MKKKLDQGQQKQEYEAPRVLASYDKDDLEDAVGIDLEVEGQSGGCGCGCSGCGCGS